MSEQHLMGIGRTGHEACLALWLGALALSACGGSPDADDAGADGSVDGAQADGSGLDSGACEGIATGAGCRCVGGSYWELDFDQDPTALDINGDSLVDWRMRDGMPFTSSEVSAGVWRTMRTLDTNPDANFDVSTSLHVRFRNVTVGGRGAVVWINADFSGGTYASIHTDLALQADGTQELTLFGRDRSGDVELKRVSGLSADFVDLWLLLDPDANTVTLWLDGEPMGTHDYPTRTDPSNAFASLLGWGSEAEFDFVRIESCPDGAATPDTPPPPPPPTCTDGGGLMCGGACVDPATDSRYCGARGDCAGANAGASCASGETCVSGACTPGTEPRPTPDLIVALTGTDNAGCGPVASPCRTVKYAVETRAAAGQLVGVMPGTYDETGAIDVPKRVSITGMGTDATEVVLRPNYPSELGGNGFFLKLVDSSLDQDGDQSLSYITLEAHATANVGSRAVKVQNRNNVRIHHCRITNWDRGGCPLWETSSIFVASTVPLPYRSDNWWRFIPDDIGPPGDYSTWTEWPKHPVTNFEFDHNYVLRSGPAQTSGSCAGFRPGSAANFFIMRNSTIHDNEFDLRGVYARAIAGTSSFWDNVDVYRNVFRATDAWSESWIPSDALSKSTYVLETWMHINGCEWHDNVTNDAFSLAQHKDSTIRNNVFLGTVRHGIAIETGMLSHSSVHNNYIFGGNGDDIVHTYGRSMRLSGSSIYENILINARGFGISVSVNRGFCRASASGIDGMTIYNNLLDGTGWGGIRVRADCDSVTAPLALSVANNMFMRSGAGWSGANVEMSANFDTMALNLDNNLMFNNAAGNAVTCRVLGGGSCSAADRGVSESGSVTRAPVFTGAIDPVTGSPDVALVDDANTRATSRQGTWRGASRADVRAYPGDGDASVHARGAGDWFEFRASDLSPDRPTVIALTWPRNFGAERSSAVPITVYDGDSTTPLATYTIDEASWDSSGWYYLGSLVFPSGRARLRVHSVDDGTVVADAALFVKMGYGYRLAAGSPAIDAGSSAVESVVTQDFFGNPVPNGAAPDIGIHER